MQRTIGTMGAVIPPYLAITVPTSIQGSAFLITLTLILIQLGIIMIYTAHTFPELASFYSKSFLLGTHTMNSFEDVNSVKSLVSRYNCIFQYHRMCLYLELTFTKLVCTVNSLHLPTIYIVGLARYYQLSISGPQAFLESYFVLYLISLLPTLMHSTI